MAHGGIDFAKLVRAHLHDLHEILLAVCVQYGIERDTVAERKRERERDRKCMIYFCNVLIRYAYKPIPQNDRQTETLWKHISTHNTNINTMYKLASFICARGSTFIEVSFQFVWNVFQVCEYLLKRPNLDDQKLQLSVPKEEANPVWVWLFI